MQHSCFDGNNNETIKSFKITIHVENFVLLLQQKASLGIMKSMAWKQST